jgi:hypothetical protein
MRHKWVCTVISVVAVVAFSTMAQADIDHYVGSSYNAEDGSSDGWLDVYIDDFVLTDWSTYTSVDPTTARWGVHVNHYYLTTDRVGLDYLAFMDEEGRFQQGDTTYYEVEYDGEYYYYVPELTVSWSNSAWFDLGYWEGNSHAAIWANDSIIENVWASASYYPSTPREPEHWVVNAWFEGVFTGDIFTVPEPGSALLLILGMLALRRRRIPVKAVSRPPQPVRVRRA